MLSLDTLPKIDLHCHLDGSLPLHAINNVLNRPVTNTEVEAPADCHSLAQYLECFHLPLECMQTELSLEYVSYHFMQSLVIDHITYIEVRFAPILSTIHGLTGTQVMDAVIRGLEKGKKEFGIDYQIILCAMRHHPLSLNIEVLKLAKAYRNKHVCAVDLAGGEADYPMSLFRQLFLQASIWDIPFTIHAGECGDVNNIIDAVELGAKRIGHGIALQGNKEAIALCREKQVTIELCPISNLQTKAVSHLQDYPLREFLDAGLCITVNTDNRTVSNTTLLKEFTLLQKQFQLTDAEIMILINNAEKARFS